MATPLRRAQVASLEHLIRTRPRMDLTLLDAGNAPGRQVQQLQQALKAPVALVMLFLADAEGIEETTRSAKSRGIPVFDFSGTLPEDACTASVFVDEESLGRLAAEYVIEALSRRATAESRAQVTGRVVQLTGTENNPMSKAISDGFNTALRTQPGIVLVHDAPGDWRKESAVVRTHEAMRLQRPIDVIFAHNDLMAQGADLGVRQISPEARDGVLILGVDGLPGPVGGMKMVMKGELDATIYHPLLVDVAWAQALRLLNDKSAVLEKTRFKVKPLMITPANVDTLFSKGVPKAEVE